MPCSDPSGSVRESCKVSGVDGGSCSALLEARSVLLFRFSEGISIMTDSKPIEESRVIFKNCDELEAI